MRRINNVCKAIRLVLPVLFFCACSYPDKPAVFSDRAALIAYVADEDNGLIRKVKTVNDIDIAVRCQPQVLLPNGSDSVNTHSDNLYFILSLSYKGKELLAQLPQELYGTMVQLFSFQMSDYIRLQTHEGEVSFPLAVFYQPTYNLSDANILLLVFDRKDLQDSSQISIVLRDFGLSTGEQEFVFDSKLVEHCTTISLL